MIDRLNASIRLINTLRKVNGNIDKKVNAATKLVWSSCYDLGLVYAYASKAKSTFLTFLKGVLPSQMGLPFQGLKYVQKIIIYLRVVHNPSSVTTLVLSWLQRVQKVSLPRNFKYAHTVFKLLLELKGNWWAGWFFSVNDLHRIPFSSLKLFRLVYSMLLHEKAINYFLSRGHTI